MAIWHRGPFMQLIIGADAISEASLRRVAGGVQATLRGRALLRLLDAAFGGAGSIEVLGADLDRRPLEVTSIEMSGAETRVTLICRGAAGALH